MSTNLLLFWDESNLKLFVKPVVSLHPTNQPSIHPSSQPANQPTIQPSFLPAIHLSSHFPPAVHSLSLIFISLPPSCDSQPRYLLCGLFSINLVAGRLRSLWHQRCLKLKLLLSIMATKKRKRAVGHCWRKTDGDAARTVGHVRCGGVRVMGDKKRAE